MNAQLVTIGIPCFNASDTVLRAVDSALAQDWPNLEILIVDDASTDGSAIVVEAAIAGETKTRLIRHSTNTGPAGTRNTIIDEAKGEFIAFFDDDDESLPERLSKQVGRLVAYEKQSGMKLVVCYASGIRHYSNGYALELPAIGSRGKEMPHGSAVADYLLLFRRKPDWFYGSGTPTCSLLARRSTFSSIGKFDPQLRRVEDVDFAIRLALQGGHFIGTQESLFIQHATSAADKSPEKNLESEQAIVKKYKDYLDSIGRYYYAIHWPRLRYWHFKRRYGRFIAELTGLLFRHPFTVTSHLLVTGPRRLLHERKMAKKR